MRQLTFPDLVARSGPTESIRPTLQGLLQADLGFHDLSSNHAGHDFHAFPAKFPPQLPRLFIDRLTRPGEVVLDPMAGSGTTLLEAVAAGRRAVAFDIDPLALRLCKVKLTPLDVVEVLHVGHAVVRSAETQLARRRFGLQAELERRFDPETRAFIHYWFAPETQLELMALLLGIEQVPDPDLRDFLELVFSAIIITKSGGVSLARDLAHTRPHRAADKSPRPAIPEFARRLRKNARSLPHLATTHGQVTVCAANAEAMPLADNSVDLLVTSPPYATNAIDYMRAHKFSLVWLGHSIAELSVLRRRYIGAESLVGQELLPLPPASAAIVEQVMQRDQKKGLALHRYYSEMQRVLSSAWRVVKPERAAILVVGSSTMRGIDTQTHACIAEIGRSLGFELVGMAARALDRDRRMMPASAGRQRTSQIEQRMHEEHVIVFVKPDGRRDGNPRSARRNTKPFTMQPFVSQLERASG